MNDPQRTAVSYKAFWKLGEWTYQQVRPWTRGSRSAVLHACKHKVGGRSRSTDGMTISESYSRQAVNSLCQTMMYLMPILLEALTIWKTTVEKWNYLTKLYLRSFLQDNKTATLHKKFTENNDIFLNIMDISGYIKSNQLWEYFI